MIRTFRVLALVSLAAVAAACSTDSDSADGNSAEDLTGRTFVSTSVSGTQIPGAGPMVVAFPEDGRISATAGCNRFVGGVDLSEGRVKAPDLASTMMACLPEREGADAWLTTLFDAEPRWSLDGNTFTLTGDDITVSLQDEKVVDPDLPITGTEWVVTSLRTADAVTTSTALENAAPTLVFSEDGTVTGNTGCNEFDGTAEVGDDVVLFEPLTMTRAACADPEVTTIETHILEVLAGETTYSIEGSSMTLTAPNGTDGLEFTAR
ncbi:META domain-containing protein [Rhodococcus pyridinivorans]|uniref:META domain-containing protein n=1 Tax=Rhodococcus TaxID=1827 RepID=UPI0009034D78|nr:MULTISPECIES: META domain-containing protein [Rhodococcus]APE09864.1 META domain-containing protein [Rhodococcus sp. 2G]UVT24815.1 META domain-containing protein [Rhodococcus pyridinivorans]